MEQKKYGISNLKIALFAVCKIQLLIQQLMSNNKKGWWGFIVKIVIVVVKNFKTFRIFDYKLIDDEFKDLSPKEITELGVYLSANLNIKNEKLIIEFVKSGLNTINKGFGLLK